jgi:threonine dehydratase
VKIGATRGFGAEVVLEGATIAESQASAERIAASTGAVFVHPYDDPLVIAGQGTVGLEVAEDRTDLDVFLVPVGGGGLISGIAIALKTLSPGIEVIGVETELYPAMWAALRGLPAECGGESLAEGIAVRNTGALALAAARQFVDDVVLVSESAIERAVASFLSLQKTLAEGAGAAGLAALLSDPARFRGRRVGLVLCGGNIDPRLASVIMMRDLERQERIIAVRITIADRPGVLGGIADIIGARDGNILEVNHLRTLLTVPAKGACVDVTFEAHGAEHAAEIIDALVRGGHRVERLDPP